MRYKLTIAYRGTNYHGWQVQTANELYKGETPAPGEGIPTIQQVVTRAIVSVVKHPVNVAGSSRTDSGVHAKGQVAHFDTDQVQIPSKGLRDAVNARLPPDVLITKIQAVPETFNAVTSTVSKRYQYCLWNRPDRPIFGPDLVWHRWNALDVPAMQRAAAHLVGEHDFASFARPGHGRENTVRTMLACSVQTRWPRVVIGVEGTGFLWNMVRIMVGTLVEVGMNRIDADAIPAMLAARDRTAAGPTAPPQGLYLQWIKTI